MAMNTISSQVALLIEAGKTDTIYRDVYLRRARELLRSTLDEPAYRTLGSTQKEIDDLVGRTRSAVLARDWEKAAELSGQADQMRKTIDELADVASIAKNVYEADVLAFDPFSPGKHLGPDAQVKQNGFQAQMLQLLTSLGKDDAGFRAFYDQRRGYFSGLELRSSADVLEKGSHETRSQLEQRALEAVERGDVATAHKLAKELQDYKDGDETRAGSSGTKSRYECPVNLAVPFATDANRAREFGMIENHFAAALPDIKAATDVIYSHAWDPIPPTPELEHEGVLRSEVLIESKTSAQFVTEELRILGQQFLQQTFINSGGARYLPRISEESALVEDFAETEAAADAPSKLLTALKLPRRRGLARSEIEHALMRLGAQVLAEDLHLDPVEYRLVCIPYDLYVRLGRDRNWGRWHHWTHFDGYQVVRDNRLSALVGGDGRFGGVNDLVSISRTDARDGVYTRFAVVRRARMVARWR
jgi:hypothetical protein